MVYVWFLLEKTSLCTFPSGAWWGRDYTTILAKGEKIEGGKDGSGIKTGSPHSCWLIQRLRCLEARFLSAVLL